MFSGWHCLRSTNVNTYCIRTTSNHILPPGYIPGMYVCMYRDVENKANTFAFMLTANIDAVLRAVRFS